MLSLTEFAQRHSTPSAGFCDGIERLAFAQQYAIQSMCRGIGKGGIEGRENQRGVDCI